MHKVKKEDIFFYLILIAYVIYAALFIYKSSFRAAGERYFVLFDDAMVSMRYAKNFAQGYGLVWNPGGDRIEGYTNPLWVLYMSLFHLLPIPASKISLFIQISGAVFLIANLFIVRKISHLLTDDTLVAFMAILLTAFYAPLNNWSLLGMEVSVLTLITSLSVWISLNAVRKGRFSLWLYMLLGVSTLIRIDMAIIYIVILVFMIIADSDNRRQNILWGLGILTLFIFGQTIFRSWYYGSPVPNTYYLKMEGYSIYYRITHGLYVLFLFVWDFNWVLFFLPFTILLFRRDRSVWLLLLIFWAQVGYSVYVGGDAWEHKGGSNRYISIVMPLFFILFVYTLSFIRDVFISKIQRDSKWVYRFSNLVLILFSVASLVNFNTLIDFNSLNRWILTMNPEFVRGNQQYVKIALDLKQITTPDARIAVVSAGSIPYFSERVAIDLLGKSDAVIAHQKPHNPSEVTNLEVFRPGHMKWDYDYSIGDLDPDVIVQLWRDKGEAKKYLMSEYKTGRIGGNGNWNFYLRSDSKYILWDRVELKK